MAHFEGLKMKYLKIRFVPLGYKGTKLGYKLYPKINHIKQALMKQGTKRVQSRGQGESMGTNYTQGGM